MRIKNIFSGILTIVISFFLLSNFCFSEMLSIKLSAGEYSLEIGGNDGDRISSSQFGKMNIPGKPRMPLKTYYIAIPPDAVVSKVTFDGNPRWLDGIHNIEPAKIQIPAGDSDKEILEAAEKEYNINFKTTYSVDLPFPAQSAVYVGGGGFRKYKLVRIT